MKNNVLSYFLVICAAGLMMGTVACGHSDSGMTDQSNMRQGAQNTASNNMDNNMNNSMNNTMDHHTSNDMGNSMSNGTGH